ncbi:hypothetical protein FS749_010383 [Ceratobasidium sp. UAMH 11750]|nr:hypothetical protein FS749_010383 [Ceratobasidium sp. UAMH 11750]
MSQTEEISTVPYASGSPPAIGIATYDEARQRLQSARSILSRAVQDYLSASQLVRTTCSATPQSSSEPLAGREETLLSIDAELSTLLLEGTIIKTAHQILTDTRNQSKMVAPIYLLPSEILARIFSEAACNCTNVTTYGPVPPILSPVTLSAVCRQWRTVAADHRSLWTHLDLEVHQSYTDYDWSPSEVWRERSQGAPLFVTIRQPVVDDDTGSDTEHDGHYPASMITSLIDFLLPLMCQVFSLTLILGWPRKAIAERVLGCWAECVTPGRAKVLKVYTNPEYGFLRILPLLKFHHSLPSLETICFCNTVPSWPSWDISNLTDLHLHAELSDSYWSMTQFELGFMLASCPKLQNLTLNGLDIQESWGLAPNPAVLNELQVLDIGCTKTSVLVSVLDAINPGDTELRLDICLFYTCVDPHDALPAVRLFVNRSNVETLRWACYGEPCCASQFGPFPHVRTLAFQHGYFSDLAKVSDADQGLKTYVNQRPTDSQAVLWPDLQELQLYDCVLEKEHLYGLISLHSIRTLCLLGCFQGQQAEKKYRLGSKARREYMQLLSGVVTEDCIFRK